MKKIKILNQLTALMISILIVFSCSKGPVNENTNHAEKETFVTKEFIAEIAGSILYPIDADSSNLKSTRYGIKEIQSIDEIKSSIGKTSMYIVNYVTGGFIILSADIRMKPILGFSLDTKFIFDENSLPPSLKFWIEDELSQIAEIQNSNKSQDTLEGLAWAHVINSIIGELNDVKNDPIEDCYEHTEIYTKGPLMNTKWYQTGAFNDELHNITCNGSGFQVYAGCVPIAMAQVMKYHQHPGNYNWTNMPLTYASNTTAIFIEDIHEAIGSYYPGQPTYDCDGTGVNNTTNMGLIMQNYFNYSSAIKANYNYITVKSNLDYNRPVILSGRNSSGGHMWVCDGYRTTNFYFDDCTGIGYLHFYMNWGWYDGLYNGWFDYNNFNPGNTNYNSEKKMIYNIIP